MRVPREYEYQSLSIVRESGILSKQDLTTLQALQDELREVFDRVQIFRTRTEMEASVLNDLKFPTPDSKYWQAVREQDVMFQELVLLSYDYRRNEIEIKKLERDLAKEQDELERELLEVEIARRRFIGLLQRRTAKDRVRELKEWHKIKEGLRPAMVAGFDDPNDHQLVSYTRRWANQFLAMGKNGDPAERSNILGQLFKGVSLCRERGLLDEALPPGSRQRKAVERLSGGVNSGHLVQWRESH